MKQYIKSAILLFGLLMLIGIVGLFIQKAVAIHFSQRNVQTAIDKSIKLAEVDKILSRNVATGASCDQSEFSTVCEADISFDGNGKSLTELESYIQSTTSKLKEDGWSVYSHDSTSEAATFYYRQLSKKYGKIDCQVIMNYASIDPVTKQSPAYSQSIKCSEEPRIHLPL